MYGYAASEMIGRPIATLVPPGVAEESERTLQHWYRGERIGDHDTVGVRKDGTLIDVSLTASPLHDDGPDITGIAVIARDVTARKRAEAELHLLQGARSQLLGRTIRAEEQERTRLAAELHDGPVQRLTALDIMTETALGMIEPDEPKARAAGLELLRTVQGKLRGTISGLRRLMFELHPPALRDRGLEAALTDYLEQLRPNTNMKLHLGYTLTVRPRPELETTLYRVVQEALANAARHARAANAWVTVREHDGCLELEVRDDGEGFDPRSKHPNPVTGEHFGLMAMRERVEMAGGRFEMASRRGKGASVTATIPMGDV
jgi:PAS domain S-box-containing protein